MFRRSILGHLAAIFILFAAVPAMAQHAPAIWKMSNEDSTVYLLGTIHLLKENTPWYTDSLQDITQNADTLTLELSPDETGSANMMALVQRLGFYGPDESLSDHLAEDSHTRLMAEFQKRSIPTQVVERMKPWMAGIQLTVVAAVQAGFLPQYGVDSTLSGIAEEQGKEIRGLETAEQQLSLFANMSDEAQAAFIEEGLDQLEDLDGYFEKLKTLWLKGDTNGLDRLLRQGLEDNQELAEALLYKRNRSWVAPLSALLNEPGVHLVAVGAAHLVGDQSVIDLLQQNGHTLERY